MEQSKAKECASWEASPDGLNPRYIYVSNDSLSVYVV